MLHSRCHGRRVRRLALLSAVGSSSASFTNYTLVSKTTVGSSNSQLLRFALPPGATLGGLGEGAVPVTVYARALGLKKSYSPVSRADEAGAFDLLVKPYAPREGGGLAAHLCSLGVGKAAELQVKATRVMHGSPGVLQRWRNLALVAGGTGIAPFVQILRHVLPDDAGTAVRLLYSSRNASDILMRDEIDALAAKYGPDRLGVTYVVTGDGAGAEAGEGACDEAAAPPPGAGGMVRRRIDAELLRDVLPGPAAPGTMVMVCGTDGFVDALAGPTVRAPADPVTGKKGKKEQGPLLGLLASLGYEASQVYKF